MPHAPGRHRIRLLGRSCPVVWCLAVASVALAQERGTVRHAEGDRPTLTGGNPDGVTGTFSIAAIDPEHGLCGAAVASKYPAVGRAVAHARAGVGGFCTQYWVMPAWGPRALDLLEAGRLPEEVVFELLHDDTHAGLRQLGIIDMQGRSSQRHPVAADAEADSLGAMSGRTYVIQGNTLTGRDVIVAMGKAFEETPGTLADRLVAALVAGDCAGGDHRGRLAAGVRVCRASTEGYWLDLHVDRHDDAVIELARRYAALDHEAKGRAGGHPHFEHPCPNRPESRPPIR